MAERIPNFSAPVSTLQSIDFGAVPAAVIAGGGFVVGRGWEYTRNNWPELVAGAAAGFVFRYTATAALQSVGMEGVPEILLRGALVGMGTGLVREYIRNWDSSQGIIQNLIDTRHPFASVLIRGAIFGAIGAGVGAWFSDKVHDIFHPELNRGAAVPPTPRPTEAAVAATATAGATQTEVAATATAAAHTATPTDIPTRIPTATIRTIPMPVPNEDPTSYGIGVNTPSTPIPTQIPVRPGVPTFTPTPTEVPHPVDIPTPVPPTPAPTPQGGFHFAAGQEVYHTTFIGVDDVAAQAQIDHYAIGLTQGEQLKDLSADQLFKDMANSGVNDATLHQIGATYDYNEIVAGNVGAHLNLIDRAVNEFAAENHIDMTQISETKLQAIREQMQHQMERDADHIYETSLRNGINGYSYNTFASAMDHGTQSYESYLQDPNGELKALKAIMNNQLVAEVQVVDRIHEQVAQVVQTPVAAGAVHEVVTPHGSNIGEEMVKMGQDVPWDSKGVGWMSSELLVNYSNLNHTFADLVHSGYLPADAHFPISMSEWDSVTRAAYNGDPIALKRLKDALRFYKAGDLLVVLSKAEQEQLLRRMLI
jgi:hypothetical protein